MPSSLQPGPLNVEQLLEAVNRLSPAQQREFRRRLAARHAKNGARDPDEASLIHAARAHLPAAAERRLKKIIIKSERGDLTPKELADYQTLAQQVQRIDAARLDALAELARRRGQPVRKVRAEIEGDKDGA